MAHATSFRIVIPTRDGARWLGGFAHAYARLGLRPLYLLDDRTRDDSRAILAAHDAAVVEVTPAHDRGEDVIWRGIAAADAAWVLRMDDDEMPSRALIDWIGTTALHRPEPAFYVSARQAWHGGYSRMEDFYFNHARPDFLMPQPRLFRPDRVTFTDALHTAGIVVPPDTGWAPRGAFFLHFDWLLRGPEERLAKLARYEAQRPGGGRDFAHFSMPEMQEPSRLRITPLETDEFAPLLADLTARRA